MSQENQETLAAKPAAEPVKADGFVFTSAFTGSAEVKTKPSAKRAAKPAATKTLAQKAPAKKAAVKKAAAKKVVAKKAPAKTAEGKPVARKAAVKKVAAKKAPAKTSTKVPVKAAKNALPAKTKPVAKTKVTSKVTAKAEKPVTKAAAKPATKVKGTGKRASTKLAKPATSKSKVRKPKLIRDSFTMPDLEYQVLSDVKKAFLKAGVSIKKSELLRAGVALVKGLEFGKLHDVINKLTPIKAGRPKKEK